MIGGIYDDANLNISPVFLDDPNKEAFALSVSANKAKDRSPRQRYTRSKSPSLSTSTSATKPHQPKCRSSGKITEPWPRHMITHNWSTMRYSN
jgi:hypothetical protein